MQKCLVEVYNSKTKKSEWLQGEILASDRWYPGWDSDVKGYDVRVGNREFIGCHPDCVRPLGEER